MQYSAIEPEPIPCIMSKCTETVPFKQLFKHLLEVHSKKVNGVHDCNAHTVEWWIEGDVHSTARWPPFFFTCFDNVFLYMSVSTSHGMWGWVWILSEEKEAERFVVETRMQNNGIGIQWKGAVHSIRKSVTDIIQGGNVFIFNSKEVQNPFFFKKGKGEKSYWRTEVKIHQISGPLQNSTKYLSTNDPMKMYLSKPKDSWAYEIDPHQQINPIQSASAVGSRLESVLSINDNIQTSQNLPSTNISEASAPQTDFGLPSEATTPATSSPNVNSTLPAESGTNLSKIEPPDMEETDETDLAQSKESDEEIDFADESKDIPSKEASIMSIKQESLPKEWTENPVPIVEEIRNSFEEVPEIPTSVDITNDKDEQAQSANKLNDGEDPTNIEQNEEIDLNSEEVNETIDKEKKSDILENQKKSGKVSFDGKETVIIPEEKDGEAPNNTDDQDTEQVNQDQGSQDEVEVNDKDIQIINEGVDNEEKKSALTMHGPLELSDEESSKLQKWKANDE